MDEDEVIAQIETDKVGSNGSIQHCLLQFNTLQHFMPCHMGLDHEHAMGNMWQCAGAQQFVNLGPSRLSYSGNALSE